MSAHGVIALASPAEGCACRGAVGVLDSGVGGLSVLVRLVERMPHQPFLYFADTAWCPYGPRPQAQVRARVSAIVNEMLALGCVAVVLACNTATSAAVAHLRARVAAPVVGMEPAVKPAARLTKSGHIAVLGTEGTIRGAKLQRLEECHGAGVRIHHVVGHGLVQLVEGGHFEDAAACEGVARVLAPLSAYPVDQLVLGCTHYPFLRGALRRVLPSGVWLVDPAPAVARQVARVCGGLVESGGGGVIFSSSGADLALERARLGWFFRAYAGIAGAGG